MHTHRVQTPDGGPLDGTHYRSLPEAVLTIAEVYGWAEPGLYGPYTVVAVEDADATSRGWSVYPTRAEADADPDGTTGAYMPRVVELLRPVADVER